MANYTKQQLQQIAYNTAVKYGVPPQIVMGIIDKESGWNPQAKNFSNIEKSYGLMQINTKAHPDYKGDFDPVKNIDYGVRLLAGLIKRHNGDIAKAVASYNGSGQAAKNYSADVMNNRIKKYSDTVANMKGMPTEVAINPSNESGMTGAAASMNLPSNDSRYVVQAPSIQDVRQSVINPQDERAYVNQALGGNTNENQYQQLKTMYLTGGSGMTYSQMVDAAQSLGISQDRILQEIPQGQPDTQADRIAQKIMQLYNPQDSIAKQQVQMQALQQMQAANPNNKLYDKLNEAYNQYNQIIESDPRLQNQGYRLDPRQMNNLITLSRSMQNQVLSPEDIMAMQQMQYKANIANQAGVPYDVYMATQGDRIKAQAAAKLQQAQDLLKVGAIGSEDYNNLLKQVQNIVTQDSTILGKQIEQVGDVYKQQMTNTGNLQQEAMKTLGNVQTTGMNNAAKLEGDNLALVSNVYGNLTDAQKATMANMLGIDKAVLDAQVNKYQTDVQANTSRENVLTQEGTKLQELNIKQPLYNAQAGYYEDTGYLNRGMGNMYYPQTVQTGQPQSMADKLLQNFRGIQPQVGGLQ